MKRKLISFAVAEGLSKGANWLTLAILPLFLRPGEYGIVGLLVALEGTLSTILLIGQESAILRFYHSDQFILVKSIRLNLIVVVGLELLLIIIHFFRNSILGIPIYPFLFLFTTAICFFNISKLFVSYSRIVDNLKLFWNCRFLYQAMKLLSVVLICYLFSKGVYYIFATFLTGLIFFVILLFFYKKYFKSANPFSFSGKIYPLLIFGLPLIFHSLGGSILSYADRFFIEGYLDKSELGIYTFAYSIGSSLVFFYGITLITLEPLVYRSFEKGTNYKLLLKSYILVIPLFAFLLSLLILFFYPLYVSKMLNIEYMKGFRILPIILAGHLIIPIYNIGNMEFIILNKPKFIAYSTIISACINLILNYLLIPRWGLMGAAISTFFTYFSLGLVINLFLIRLKINKINFYLNGIYFLIFMLVCLFFYVRFYNIYVFLLLITMSILFILKSIEKFRVNLLHISIKVNHQK